MVARSAKIRVEPAYRKVATALTATILSLGLERDTETRTVLAFEKLLWIQNDFISRHYQA